VAENLELMPVIPASREEGISKMAVGGQFGQNLVRLPS
jgi:hypothetical protein